MDKLDVGEFVDPFFKKDQENFFALIDKLNNSKEIDFSKRGDILINFIVTRFLFGLEGFVKNFIPAGQVENFVNDLFEDQKYLFMKILKSENKDDVDKLKLLKRVFNEKTRR